MTEKETKKSILQRRPETKTTLQNLRREVGFDEGFTDSLVELHDVLASKGGIRVKGFNLTILPDLHNPFVDLKRIADNPFKIELSSSERRNIIALGVRQEGTGAVDVYTGFAQLQEFMKQAFPDEKPLLRIEPFVWEKRLLEEIGNVATVEQDLYEVTEEDLVRFTALEPEYRWPEIRARENNFLLKFHIPNIFGDNEDCIFTELFFKGEVEEVRRVMQCFATLMKQAHRYPSVRDQTLPRSQRKLS